MKRVCLIFVLLLYSNTSFAQNDLVGNWYLLYINYNGVQFDNYFNNDPLNLYINFTETLQVDGSSVCNDFIGVYTIDTNNSTINIGVGVTLASCTGPRGVYESKHLDNILLYNYPSPLIYQITGSGIDQTLKLTSINGNFAVYGKTAPIISLFTTWYLSTIETNTSTIYIPLTDTSKLNLSTFSTHPMRYNDVSGYGKCNNFIGSYDPYEYDDNVFKITLFDQELNTCSNNSYETTYFSILSDSATNYLSYEITENGQTLILTNLLGEKLIFGKQVLSASKKTFNNLSISLIENPVDDILNISISKQISVNLYYTIYSIDGKTITNSLLNHSNKINVEYLNSGMYFLSFRTKENHLKMIKFMKR